MLNWHSVRQPFRIIVSSVRCVDIPFSSVWMMWFFSGTPNFIFSLPFTM